MMSNKEGGHPVSPEPTGNTVTQIDQTSHRSAALNFGPFRLDLRGGQLLRGSEPVLLRPKTWGVLHYLAGRPGELLAQLHV